MIQKANLSRHAPNAMFWPQRLMKRRFGFDNGFKGTMRRVQERLKAADWQELQNSFLIIGKTLSSMKKLALILPLPRAS